MLRTAAYLITYYFAMKRFFAAWLCGVLFFSCAGPRSDGAAQTAVGGALEEPATSSMTDLLIVPGKAVGAIRIEEDVAKLIDSLGQPQHRDAAMGSALYAWAGRGGSSPRALSILARHNMGAGDEKQARIKMIRVTSDEYKTKEGISTICHLDDIKSVFSLKPGKFHRSLRQYSAAAQGIAFDIDTLTQKCAAITIFPAGDSGISSLNIRD